MKVLFITVGTGRTREDIAKMIIFSIKNQNPDKIIFLCSGKTRKETLPIVENLLKENGISVSYDILEFEDVDDVEEVFKKTLEEMEKYRGEKWSISIDYTSGTKPMSAGLVLASIFIEKDILMSYVGGKRDSEGRVIGTQMRNYIFEPSVLFFTRDKRTAIKFYNNLQFESACETIKVYKESYEEAKFLNELFEAYSLWDKFNHKEAFNKIKKIYEDFTDYLRNYGIKSSIEKNKEFLYKCLSGEKEYKLYDLYLNINRRIREGKWDDALARTYRSFEFMAQIFLKREFGIETDDVKLENLPPSLRFKFQNLGPGQKVKIGLIKTYEILKELGHKLGKRFYEDYHNKESRLRKLLDLRNHSILAHGFIPIKEEYAKELINILEDYYDEFFKNWRNEIEKGKFPVIKF